MVNQFYNFFRFFLLLCFTFPSISALASSKILVKPYIIKNQEVFDSLNVIGQCKDKEVIEYYSTMNGRVDKILQKQGQKIQKGEIILAINQDIALATKRQSETNYELAKQIYERNYDLFKANLISQAALEKSKLDLENAKFSFVKQDDLFSSMVISAPFDGILSLIYLEEGTQVKFGDYLFSIIKQDDEKIVIFELPESSFKKMDNKTEVFLADIEKNLLRGKIIAKDNAISEKNGTIAVKVLFYDNDILHNSYVHANFIFDKHFALTAPEQAISKNDKGSYIYLIDSSNKVKQIYVRLGYRINNFVEIISPDIKGGDKIVLEGITKIYDGALVEF